MGLFNCLQTIRHACLSTHFATIATLQWLIEISKTRCNFFFQPEALRKSESEGVGLKKDMYLWGQRGSHTSVASFGVSITDDVSK